MKPSYLIRGFPGHPLHPPLTDATIGLYTGALIFAVLSLADVATEATAKGWWLLLIAGLVVGAATAVTGLVDEPTERAVTPGHSEKELAEGG